MGQQPESANFEKQMMTLGRVLQTLREEENVEVLIDTIISYIQTEFNYNLIWIGLYDRLDHRLIGKGGITPTTDNWLLKQRFILTPGDLLEQVVIQLRPVIVPDLRTETRAGEWRKAAQAFNVQGAILYPMRYKDRCFGVVLLGSTEWGISPSSAEKEQLSMILGCLATTLNQIEMTWQYQQAKRPDQPILRLLSEFHTVQSLDRCLEIVVEETHHFIEPTRTNIYWYYRDGRYFWRRVSNQQKPPGFSISNQSASGITVQDLGEFYKALASQQLVVIGESRSSLKADTTERLMEKIRARSLLAAPIVSNQELLGFLAVEGQNPRIWQENEKNFLRGVAKLVALNAPVAEMDEKIRQIELNRALTSEVVRAIASNEDWTLAIKTTAHQLCQRLNVVRFLLLKWNPSAEQFEILYQHYPLNRRPLTSPFKALDLRDWQLLNVSRDTIRIENWDEETTLLAWREAFREIGTRSLLVCPILASSALPLSAPLAGVIAITSDTPRTWETTEQDLIKIVSQQLGLILQQWQLNQEVQLQQKALEAFATGWTILEKTDHPYQLEQALTQHIAETLESKLGILITWQAKGKKGTITASWSHEPQLIPKSQTLISIAKDPLIQQVLMQPGVLGFKNNEIPPATQQWLPSLQIEQGLAIALKTAPEHHPTAILLIADSKTAQQEYSLSLKMLTLLASQFAWSRRYLRVGETLHAQREELQWLNWYKQRRLEELYRIVGGGLKQLNELNPPVQTSDEQRNTLTQLRYQQLLRQIGTALASTTTLLKQEQWRLQNNREVIPLANLLRRVRDRISPILRNRQLQLQVRQDGNFSIIGDNIKLELVLYELLVTACHRCKPGQFINIKTQPLNDHQLELMITDPGTLHPQLIAELQDGCPVDILAPSPLDHPLGQYLMICKRIIQQMGGQFSLEHPENQPVISRLLLPLGTTE